MKPNSEVDEQTRHVRFAAWLIVGAAIIVVGLLTGNRAWAQSSVICAGNSSIPISPTLLQLSRNGPVTYEVSLCTTPTAPVQVSVEPDPLGKVIIAPSVLTFTTPVSQTVSVTINASVPESETFTVAIRHSVASADPAYNWGTTNTPSVIATYMTGSITGLVFDDRNGNLTHDTGEPLIPGASVSLMGGPSTSTDATGRYRFLGLSAGVYWVTLVTPSGYKSAVPTQASVNVSVGFTSVVSFPLIELQVIRGVVFEDSNGNGVQDPGEHGLEGVTINRGDGPTALTDAAGQYQFASVSPGQYTVSVNVPAGYTAGGPSERTVYVGDGSAAQANFGLQLQDSINGVVFEDINANGIQEQGEPGVPGVTIQIVGAVSIETDGNGEYRFTGVGSGVYTLAMIVPPGYVAGNGTSRLVNVGGGSAAQANFTLLAQGVIQGAVFDDGNGNGVQDPSEPGIAGVQITITGGPSVATDSFGVYRFVGVAPGSYTLNLGVPAGFVAGSFTVGYVYVPAGGSAQLSFALQAQGAVQGVVFEDMNGNGTQEIGEPGIGGLAVSLSGVGVVESAIDGRYRFVGVVPGAYTLSVATPDGYSPSLPTTRELGLTGGSSIVANFGFQPEGVVQGFVFIDNNGNGVLDSNELGIAGMPLTLVDTQGVTITTVSSAGNGSYRFGDLVNGRYRLIATPIFKLVALAGLEALVDVQPGRSSVVNMPFQQSQVIYGAVFEDWNGNQLQERFEQGVAGVLVQLARDWSPISIFATTAANGDYVFPNLPTGSYTVTPRIDGTGFAVTGPSQVNVSLSSGRSGSALFGVLPQNSIIGTAIPGTLIELIPVTTTQQVVAAATYRTTYANGLGFYYFLNPEPGTYRLQSTPPPGFTAVQPFIEVTVNPTGVVRADFHAVRDGAIQGVVFEDLDANGLQDAAEQGLGGLTVTLMSEGTPVSQTVTSANGGYLLSSLDSGVYTLVVESAQFVQLSAHEVTLQSDQSGAIENIGMAPRYAITGRAYLDFSGDPTIAVTTTGLANIQVSIIGPEDKIALTTVRGFYRLDQVIEGTYRVVVNVPNGFGATTPVLYIVTLSNSASGSGINFGMMPSSEPVLNEFIHLPVINSGFTVVPWVKNRVEAVGPK